MNGRFGGNSRVGVSRRGRYLVLGAGACFLSILAMLATVVYQRQEIEAETAVNVPEQPIESLAFGTVVLLAPTQRVVRGTKLSQVTLREVFWPRNEVPEGAIRRSEDIEDMFAKADLAPSQPIVRASLSPTAPLGGISDLIPPGHRATTIEVDSTQGVEGWATPGAHVDVILTYHDSKEAQKKTQIAVEDAVVLSFNGDTKRFTGTEKSGGFNQTRTSTVTLAVPIEDAMRIHTAKAMGRISLILRGQDTHSAGTLVVSEDAFRNNSASRKPHSVPLDTKGFATFTDDGGSRRHVELRQDKWWNVNPDDDV